MNKQMAKIVFFLCLFILNNTFASQELTQNLPRGALKTFRETIDKNYFPTPNPHKGILDGGRKNPRKILFKQAEIDDSKKIKHVIVIFQENWSFDSLYGSFPGAMGISSAKQDNVVQVDLLDNPYRYLLPCINSKTGHPYSEIPENLPNEPFDLEKYIPMNKMTGDAIHQFYHEQYQINGGQMNRFSTYSNVGGFVMSNYDITNTRMGKLAKEFVLCDQWFHSCYGGSMCGALWLFTAQMPLWPNASPEVIARLLPSGVLIKDGFATPDGYAINDAEPFYPPYAKGTPIEKRVPPQNYKTLGDLLSENNVSWKWYAEGWDDAVKGNPAETFAFHHQAPVYFTQFAPGTKAREEHLNDLKQFYVDLENKNVPAVSIIRSLDHFSQHPGDGTLEDGLNWCADIVDSIRKSYLWEDCAIIVTYDENGGRWDHFPPPVVDRWGPGTRVPATVISPFAKKGFIDHTTYETVSILKFIEERWELPSLSTRDEAANNLLNAFDFNQTPRL